MALAFLDKYYSMTLCFDKYWEIMRIIIYLLLQIKKVVFNQTISFINIIHNVVKD